LPLRLANYRFAFCHSVCSSVRLFLESHRTMIGDQRPRLCSLPEYETTAAGRDAVELAAMAGLQLDDWQQYVLHGALGESGGKWAAFEVELIVSRQNGKGAILEARELAGLFLFNEQLIIHTAHEFKTGQEAFRRVLYWIENTPEFDRRVARVRTSHGEEGIELKSGQRLRFLARSKGSGRGFSCDCLIYDEAMILDAVKVGATLPTLSARRNPQVWYTASAGFKTSSQLALVRRRAVAGGSPGLAAFEWSIQPHDEYCQPHCADHDDIDDPRSWAKANPAFGIRISAEHITRERDALRGNETEFLRERCGVGEYPAPDDGWLVIPRKWYDASADTADEPPRPARPVFAVEVSPDRSTAAIAVAGERPDGLTGIQVAEYRQGTKWVLPRCVAIHESWKPARWIIDPRAGAGSLADDLRRAGLPVEETSARDVANACGQFFDGMRDGKLAHYGQSALRTALAGADRRPLSEAWAWDRRQTSVDASPLMAATFAYWGFLRFGSEGDYELAESVHFDLTEIGRLYRAGVYGPADLARLRDAGLIDDKGLEALTHAGFSSQAA
jgi:hypothetical protein